MYKEIKYIDIKPVGKFIELFKNAKKIIQNEQIPSAIGDDGLILARVIKRIAIDLNHPLREFKKVALKVRR